MSCHLGKFSAAFLVAAVAFVPRVAQAQSFINVNRTVALGNPVDNFFGPNGVYIGTTFAAPTGNIPNLTVEFVAPAFVQYSNLSGAGVGIYSNSLVNVLGGTFQGGISVNEQSTLNVTGGSLAGVGVGGTTATANLSGGTVATSGGQIALFAASGGTLNVNAGATVNSIFALSSNGGATNITGGTLGNLNQITPTTNQYAVNAGGSNLFNMSGGIVYGGVSSSSTSTGIIRGGTVNGGVLTALDAVFAITGGTINGGLIAAQNAAQFQIGGGTINGNGNDFRFFNSGSARITGGTFGGTFAALGSGNLDFFGTNLVLSNATAGTYSNSATFYGQSTYAGTFYRLTGVLQNGQAIDNTVFQALGQTGAIRLNATGAPEPASFTFLLPGLATGAGVLRRRRQRTAQ